MPTATSKRNLVTRVGSVAAAAVLLISAQSALAEPASADRMAPAPPEVSVSDPATAGRVDTTGRHLKVEDTSGSAAERTILARKTGGELTTTIIQSVPINAPNSVARTTSAAPLTTSTTHAGPVEEKLTPTLLPETQSEWTPAFAYAVSETSVSFAWYTAVGEFQVWEGSDLVATSRKGAAVVDGLAAGSSHTFELTGLVDSEDGPVPGSRTMAVALHASDSETADANGVIAPLTYQQYTTAVTYRTFIPDLKVDASMCNVGDTSYTFDGDFRSFSLPGVDEPFQTPNYRTLMALNINWDNRLFGHSVGVRLAG